MQMWDNLTPADIIKTLEQELAKAQNELKCAEADINKSRSRIAFLLTAVHYLKKDMKI